MLVDKHNRNIPPLPRELVECAFDRRVFRLLVDDEEVLLRVGGVSDVLDIYPSISFDVLRLCRERGDWRRTYADAREQDPGH